MNVYRYRFLCRNLNLRLKSHNDNENICNSKGTCAFFPLFLYVVGASI